MATTAGSVTGPTPNKSYNWPEIASKAQTVALYTTCAILALYLARRYVPSQYIPRYFKADFISSSPVSLGQIGSVAFIIYLVASLGLTKNKKRPEEPALRELLNQLKQEKLDKDGLTKSIERIRPGLIHVDQYEEDEGAKYFFYINFVPSTKAEADLVVSIMQAMCNKEYRWFFSNHASGSSGDTARKYVKNLVQAVDEILENIWRYVGRSLHQEDNIRDVNKHIQQQLEGKNFPFSMELKRVEDQMLLTITYLNHSALLNSCVWSVWKNHTTDINQVRFVRDLKSPKWADIIWEEFKKNVANEFATVNVQVQFV